MKKLLKFKIEEVVVVTRTRIVEIEINNEEEESIYLTNPNLELDLDNKEDFYPLHILTELVRQQHSREGDMTEQVLKAKRL